MDVRTVVTEVRRAAPSNARRAGGAPGAPPNRSGSAAKLSDSADRREREALKLALQYPKLAGADFDDLEADEFTLPAYEAVRIAVAAAGGVSAADDPSRWIGEVAAAASDDTVRALINRLAVEPPMLRELARGKQAVDARYVTVVLTGVRAAAVERHEADVRSRLQRLDPKSEPAQYLAAFTELNELVRYRKNHLGSLDQ
jgi:DNA primase